MREPPQSARPPLARACIPCLTPTLRVCTDVYDHEIRAWIPRGMSADEWLAQEAMRKQEEALRPPLGPPPTGPPPTGPPPPGGFRRS